MKNLLILFLAGCAVGPAPTHPRTKAMAQTSAYNVQADAVVGYIQNPDHTIYLGNSGLLSGSNDVWMVDGVEMIVTDTNQILSLIEPNP